MTTVDVLVASGRLERVPADLATARVRLGRAEQHLTTAAGLLGQDDEVAHGSLHDAARKAITAHMLANGLRATNRAGAHEAVGRYAVAVLPAADGSVARFDRMRRRRNRSEDDDLVLGGRDVQTDLEHARAIVAAVSAALAVST